MSNIKMHPNLMSKLLEVLKSQAGNDQLNEIGVDGSDMFLNFDQITLQPVIGFSNSLYEVSFNFNGFPVARMDRVSFTAGDVLTIQGLEGKIKFEIQE